MKEERETARQAEALAQGMLVELEMVIMHDLGHEAGEHTQERDVRTEARERGLPQPSTLSTPNWPRRVQEHRETDSPINTRRIGTAGEDEAEAEHGQREHPAELTPTQKTNEVPYEEDAVPEHRSRDEHEIAQMVGDGDDEGTEAR